MSVHVKQAGVWESINPLLRKQNGTWKEVQEAYRKDAGAWQIVYQGIKEYDLTSGTNVNIANWLVSQGAKPNTNVIVNLPAGQTIGGTVAGGYAIEMGNISVYKSLIFNIRGEVYGVGGTSASKAGSHALRSLYPFTLDVKNTGRIYAGGGAGGAGGRGGNGNDRGGYTAEKYQGPPQPSHYWTPNGNCSTTSPKVYCWYEGTNVGGACFNPYIIVGSWLYAEGSHHIWGFYKMKRAKLSSSGGGNGGAGGAGAGYNQAAAGGGGGSNSSNRAGRGGAGGSGAAYGAAGAGGAKGSTGYTYTRDSSGRSNGGSGGAAGGAAGNAIIATGVQIKFANAGVVAGSQDFIGVPIL